SPSTIKARCRLSCCSRRRRPPARGYRVAPIVRFVLEAATMSNIEIITFGCRLNAYESEVMRKHAADAGLEGAVIVNTCAVTQESVRQARQAIRKARREHPEAKIVVTGCAAQIDPAHFAAMQEVDHIIGNHEKTGAATFRGLGCGDTERV